MTVACQHGTFDGGNFCPICHPSVDRRGRFWLVWSPTGPTSPRVRMFSFSDAKRAAEDMARSHPGQEFYVLRTESVSVSRDVITTNFGGAQ